MPDLQNEIDSPLLDLAVFIELVHEHFEKERKEYENKVFSEMAKMPQEYMFFTPWDRYQQEFDTLKHVYPSILYNATFAAMYSLVDVELNRICTYLQTADGITKSVREAKGRSLLDRVSNFITSDLRREFPSDSDDWKEMKAISMLRNCIVHNNSIVRNQLKPYVQSQKTISLLSDNRVILTREYCIKSVQMARRFFKSLLSNHLRKTQASFT